MSADGAFCDVDGCEEAWIFVQHRNHVPVKRRCHRHWFEELRLVSTESRFTILRPITPAANDPSP